MALELKINEEIKAAMIAKNADRLKALRAIKAEILLAKTSEKGGEITSEVEIKMLQKMVKQRKESATVYAEQNRPELAATELSEAKVIEEFLPAQMSREEIEIEVRKIIENLGATSAKDMGKVMGAASKQFAGKADGRIISEIVKEILN